MARYEDDAVLLDSDGVTFKSYRWPGDTKKVTYDSIRSIERFEMGLWTGRFRLVGISFGRPRSWFPWARGRNSKNIAFSLDVGKWLGPTFVPDDPEVAESVLHDAFDS